MNKSLLIVICDFLLLSLLSIANFDKSNTSKKQEQEAQTALQNESFEQSQMVETLKAALDAEQQRHLELSQDVDKLTKTAEANMRQAKTHKKIIQERELQLKQIQSAKIELEQERTKILEKSKELERKIESADKRNASLQSEIVLASKKLEKSTAERLRLENELGQMHKNDSTIKSQLQAVQLQLHQNKENLARLQKESEQLKQENKNIETEKQKLATRLEIAAEKTKIYEDSLKRTQSLYDRERAEVQQNQKIILERERQLKQMQQSDTTIKTQLKSVQEQLRQNKENLAKLQKESEQLKQEKRTIEMEKQALATRLAVADTKTEVIQENFKRAQIQIDIEKAEKQQIFTHAQKLETNVANLATSQKQLTKNIAKLRPQTSSEIFSKIEKNLVDVVFQFTEGGLLGKKNAQTKIKTFPILIGTKIYIVFDASMSPLTFSKSAEAPEKLEISIIANAKTFTPENIFLIDGTKQTLAFEIPKDFIPKENVLSMVAKENTYSYPDCVIIDTEKKYHGSTQFIENFKDRRYAKLDVGVLESIFKTFSPEKNNIALTKNGEVVGILTSSTDLFVLTNIAQRKSIQVGKTYTKASATIFLQNNN